MDKNKAHVLDSDSTRRAKLARSLIENGVHAEIYECMDELSARCVTSGIVIAHHDTFSSAANDGDEARLFAQIGLPLSLYSEKPVLARAIQAMLDGAIDYMTWPVSPEKLSCLIEKTSCQQSIRIREMQARSWAINAVSSLSKRECEVLKLVVDGHCSKSAARNLGISHRTVEIHRAKAFHKINARSVAEAVRVGLYAGVHHQ